MSPSSLPNVCEWAAAAAACAPPHVGPLSARETQEVLASLAERLLHTVNIAGLIRDNGVSSPLNRGTTMKP